MKDIYRVLVTTDSVCDLPEELIANLPVAVMPYYVVTDCGRFADGKELNARDLLIFLDKKANMANSEAPDIEEYKKFFSEMLTAAERIIHISMGRFGSKGYENARKAAGEFQGVKVVDSGQISSGVGMIVLKAAELAEKGESVDSICEAVSRYSKAVHSSFILKDIDFADKNKRLSHWMRRLCDRMLLHPVMKMKKSRIRMGAAFAGQWDNIIRKFIKSTLSRPWKIDEKILIITHTGLDRETIERIQTEVSRILSFEKIYVTEATSAVSCNCGRGCFGLTFAQKTHTKEIRIRDYTLGERAEAIRRKLAELITSEDFPIRQRIINLILSAVMVGGTFSGIVSFCFGQWKSAVIVFIMLVLVFYCLRLSIVKKKPTQAALILCFLANTILFPIMYYASGGLESGMPIWFVLGLIFDWLILTGWSFFAMFVLNAVVMVGCIIVGEKYPQLIEPVSAAYTRNDIIQTIIFVVCILGVIYKYQTHLYEKQRKELQEHEEELLKSNGAKDLFLANMSHEIRTPINGIMGMNTMLLRECQGNDTLTEYGKNIQTSSQTLLSLVNNILDVSKIEAGRFEIVPVEYQIFSLINDCYQIALSRCIAKKLEMEIEFNPAIPAGLYGDEIRIRQVINNLLSNAIKYTEKGSVKLVVDMEKRGDAVVTLVISVKDTGIGIKTEDQERIFQSFARVDEKKNRYIEGTGLGLNLTQNFVELMHGTISVDSIYGQGSTFTVRIPQHIRDRRPAGDFVKKYQENLTESKPVGQTLRAPEARVLVVDDVPMNLLVAQGLFKLSGIRIETAESGEDALKRILKEKYDIIFLDHVMPGMDGIECLHRIREMKNGINEGTPIIVLTANAIGGIREEYIKTGFTDYLSKPIQEGQLYDILKKYLPKEKIEDTSPIPTENDTGNKDLAFSGESRLPGNDQSIRKGLSMQGLLQIPGLDTELGLKYCLEDERFYFEVIREYLKKDRSAALDEALAKEDFEDYRIQVHALKSTSLNIGAKELSEEAKKSEHACKENDFSAVRERHDTLINHYKSIYHALKELSRQE